MSNFENRKELNCDEGEKNGKEFIEQPEIAA
jgi:hypothetical protein